MQNQIRTPLKIVYVHPPDSDVGEMSHFDNVRIRTPSHPYVFSLGLRDGQ